VGTKQFWIVCLKEASTKCRSRALIEMIVIRPRMLIWDGCETGRSMQSVYDIQTSVSKPRSSAVRGSQLEPSYWK
jgi:hypothetical protein